MREFVRDATDGFFARPTVSFFGAAIPVGDNVVHVADEDGVVCEIEEISPLAQHAFGTFALGNLQPQLFVARLGSRFALSTLASSSFRARLEVAFCASPSGTPRANYQRREEKRDRGQYRER